MEIKVEHDSKTGRSQVVSTATISPDTFQDRGLKVYDDGRKSVYALHPDGSKVLSGAVGEMTPKEVDTLLHQATDKNVPTEVQYHQPVYSVSYTGSSRPSTPRTPSKTPTPTPSPFQGGSPSRNIIQISSEENQKGKNREGWKTPNKTPNSCLIQQDSQRELPRLPLSHISGQSNNDKDLILQPHSTKTPQGRTDIKTDVNTESPSLVSIKARSEGIPATTQLIYKDVDICSPSLARHRSKTEQEALKETSGDLNRHSPYCAESNTSLNLVKTLSEQQKSEMVTMIFMGYENAEDEEDEDIQAELVIIDNGGDNDNDKAKHDQNENDVEECLSYHPEGYKSKVFQPKMGIAKVTGCSDNFEDAYTNWEDLGLHKPTFIHKPGKHCPYLQGHGENEHANSGSINMEKMKLCATGR